MKLTLTPELLRLKLHDALTQPLPPLTERDIRLPNIPGKAMAIIGVRRGGKTSFLRQQAQAAIASGRPRASQLLLSFEDEHLIGANAADLAWMIDEHGRQYPALLAPRARTLYLDEIHLVAGWQTFVRRLLDQQAANVFVSGSSAKLLSREVATSLRGRGMEVLVHPFSFRESLRHRGAEPSEGWRELSPAQRTTLDAALASYLAVGGFPEAQGTETRDRHALLSSYVDVMVLRDVAERHLVTNLVALRWLQRALLAAPGGAFTVNRFHHTLKSHGVPVAKETLQAYVAYFEDAFLVRTLSMHSTSERQRLVNPRKSYPIDTGLISLYERAATTHRGRALETTVLLELERRGYTTSWLRVGEDWEVDFLAERPGDPPLLVQVCLDAEADTTWEREVRALRTAADSMPDARPLLLTLNSTPPTRRLPSRLEWHATAAWLLGEE